MSETKPNKPLGRKSYGSIPHLPGSRIGPGDHHVHDGQDEICCAKARDRHDIVIVQEKLDGTNVAVAKVGGMIVPLIRAGYRADDSPREMHRTFARWVDNNRDRFDWLAEGERVCGEWLAQAHGTRYDLPHEPFVAFDVMVGDRRCPYARFVSLTRKGGLVTAQLVNYGAPITPDRAMDRINPYIHGAIDPIEGVVYRVERQGTVDFLAKWVRPDKVDGCYLHGDPVWNIYQEDGRLEVEP